MEFDEKVLSDVHVTSENESVEGNDYTVSRFWFRVLPCGSCVSTCRGSEERDGVTDSDGDMVLSRRKNREDGEELNVLTIAHSLSTGLKDVGKQLWHGSLILADYLIHLQDKLQDKTVVELGAGTGLAGITASFFAKNVLCTDVGGDVLRLTEHNLDQNWNCLNLMKKKNYRVCQLDWMSENLVTDCGKYTITEEDVSLLNTAQIFIAGDVVYDNELTLAFLNTVYRLLSNPPSKSLYISMEKRLIFTLEDKDVVAPAYDYFCECLEALIETTSETGAQFHHQEIPVTFPQCFTYNRTKELIMCKIYTTFPDS
ncbi:methyltransferase-like protein 22 [Saccostrea echinata]|uniref:methyltransferase-like protein 22 n=1 Tax=Saccostrea echinata TaxID=191078 RepID=UPI002A818EC3|nr:methyltransferase-like protein 22 [Saccostrea echinata]